LSFVLGPRFRTVAVVPVAGAEREALGLGVVWVVVVQHIGVLDGAVVLLPVVTGGTGDVLLQEVGGVGRLGRSVQP
jgi:hypothetical protein